MKEFFKENEDIIIYIQSLWRGYKARKQFRHLLEQSKQQQDEVKQQQQQRELEEASAVKIQSAYRGFSARKTYAAQKASFSSASSPSKDTSEYIDVTPDPLESSQDAVQQSAVNATSSDIHSSAAPTAGVATPDSRVSSVSDTDARAAAVLIQRQVRGYLARKLYNNLRLQPDVKTVQRFLHVLTQSREDCALDMEVQSLKADLIVRINSLARVRFTHAHTHTRTHTRTRTRTRTRTHRHTHTPEAPPGRKTKKNYFRSTDPTRETRLTLATHTPLAEHFPLTRLLTQPELQENK